MPLLPFGNLIVIGSCPPTVRFAVPPLVLRLSPPGKEANQRGNVKDGATKGFTPEGGVRCPSGAKPKGVFVAPLGQNRRGYRTTFASLLYRLLLYPLRFAQRALPPSVLPQRGNVQALPLWFAVCNCNNNFVVVPLRG